MRNILPVAILALTVAMAAGAQAESPSAASGSVGTNVGNSLDEPMVVTADNGNVREQPNAQAKLLTTVPHGGRVVMIGTANGGAWAHVKVDGLDGYMDLVLLAKAPPAEGPSTFTTEQSAPRYMIVTADSANVRQGPSNDSELLVTLPRGSRVVVVGSDQGWSRIHGNEHDGYVESAKLADTTSTYYAPSYSTSVPTYQYQPNGQTYQYQPSYQYQPTGQTYQYQPTYQYQQNGQGYPPSMRVVNGGGGTIHQTPDSRSLLLGTVPPGYSVQVLGTVDGGWAHVVASGIDGYMSYNQLQ